jgi:peptidyl-prolyl cis-trans isomerase SurA
LLLQQVIFVIPASRRGAITGKRRAEAEASRKNYPGCQNARAFAATMHDVAIKDLGRYLLQQLPPDWKDDLAKTEQGQTAKVPVTEKGVEYISVCKRREALMTYYQMVFQEQDLKKAEEANRDVNSQEYLEVLRKKAQIVLK